MKIFGRQLKMSELMTKTRDLVIMIFRSFMFRHCQLLWIAYLKQNSPKTNEFQTRDGYKILLSNNVHDSITVMVIFCRQEYGKIIPGSTVFDVGANIGVFSLYAARCGAKRVYAFEPNKESYEVLVSNIKVNNLENVIFPFNLAVGPTDGELISIPKNSSPYNKAVLNAGEKINNYDLIESISLPSFIYKTKIDMVDFLKMDCEGAEYSIISSMKREIFALISKFRLEQHYGHEKEEIIKIFENYGFRKTHDKNLILWFDR